MKKKTAYGVKIVKRLAEKGMTQTELSSQLGIAPAYLTYIITGQRGGWKYRQQINEILFSSEEFESVI